METLVIRSCREFYRRSRTYERDAICLHSLWPRVRVWVMSHRRDSVYNGPERSHLTLEKRPPIRGPRLKKPYLERAMGLEPTTLCLGRFCSPICTCLNLKTV